jgi:hypothetical protein
MVEKQAQSDRKFEVIFEGVPLTDDQAAEIEKALQHATAVTLAKLKLTEHVATSTVFPEAVGGVRSGMVVSGTKE